MAPNDDVAVAALAELLQHPQSRVRCLAVHSGCSLAACPHAPNLLNYYLVNNKFAIFKLSNLFFIMNVAIVECGISMQAGLRQYMQRK